MNRRFFIKVFSCGAVFGPFTGLFGKSKDYFKRPVESLTAAEQETLSQYLDKLIPRDESPGALDLKVPVDIFTKAEQNQQYREILKRGCEWLNKRALNEGGKIFQQLSKEQQLLLVGHSSQATERTIERRFFDTLRNDAFESYYARPEVWSDIGFEGPPQPKGYLDFHMAPRMRART